MLVSTLLSISSSAARQELIGLQTVVVVDPERKATPFRAISVISDNPGAAAPSDSHAPMAPPT